MPLELWWLISMKADIPLFVDPLHMKEEIWKAKGKGQLSVHFNGSDETDEVILRTVISSNQLSVYGALSEMCEELAWGISFRSKGTGKPVAPHNLETMVMPLELSTTDRISQTDVRVQGNMLREYEQKFANLTEHLHLTKLCSNAGLAKTVENVKYFTTHDDTELDRLKGSCWEYTLSRSDQSSQVKRWIRGNTKISPLLDAIDCYHLGLCGVEIMIEIESFFDDKTCSWVRIVNGINKYVTEMSEETHVESIREKSVGETVTEQ